MGISQSLGRYPPSLPVRAIRTLPALAAPQWLVRLPRVGTNSKNKGEAQERPPRESVSFLGRVSKRQLQNGRMARAKAFNSPPEDPGGTSSISCTLPPPRSPQILW